jgi:sulfate transport system ATP-binding protein
MTRSTSRPCSSRTTRRRRSTSPTGSRQIEQFGDPRELYDEPATPFVMSFLGQVTRVGEALVRPHDLALTPDPQPGATEAMVARVVHLGFEVRVELVLDGDGTAIAQLTRAEAAELELRTGDIVYVRPTERPTITA